MGEARQAGRALAAVALIASAGCSVYRAVDERLDAWPRYAIPGSTASVALPAPPQFATERLPGSPCGDLVRSSFTVVGTFARYSGHFVALTPQCAGHEKYMRILVTPKPGAEWRRVSSQDLPGSKEQAGAVETAFLRGEPAASFRTVRVFVLEDGLLGVSAEGSEGPVEREDAAKFFRWVRTGTPPGTSP